MKYKKAVLTVTLVCVVVFCGCQEQQAGPTVDQSQVNRKIVDTYSDLMIQNAVVAQHTLYPYHFVNNSAQLNGLGERDLAALVQHFQENPGQITVHQGKTEPLLYQSRAQTVYEKLLAGDIPDSKIKIVSGMPGGDGIQSNAVIEILETDKTSGPSGDMDMAVSF
jgi:hypothetical protein